MGPSISLVISTLNEESNISNCILSAREFVDEVVVVDMYSADQTVEMDCTPRRRMSFRQ